MPWCDLPERFGPWKSVYNRFNRGSIRGHWEVIFQELRLEVDETGSIVDGSVIRARQDASGGKGGSNPMLWAALEEAFDQAPAFVDGRGRPLHATLTPGQKHEMSAARELLG